MPELFPIGRFRDGQPRSGKLDWQCRRSHPHPRHQPRHGRVGPRRPASGRRHASGRANARASEKDGDPSITELSDALRSQPVWEQAAGMTQHRIQLRGSEPALRQAMKAYIWKRRFRRRQTWLAWTVLLVADGALVWTDDFGFLTGAAAAATVLLATMMLGIGWARWDANIKRWRKLIAAGAEVIIEDAALSIASNISTLNDTMVTVHRGLDTLSVLDAFRCA